MSLKKILVYSLLSLMGATGAELRAEEKKEEQKKITYDEHILPIFRQRCGSCHNGNDQKGGLVLDSYAGMMQGGGSGDVIEQGDAGSSYLYMVVNHDSEPYMPPGQPKMPETELALIKQWIELGALENQGSKVVKKKNNLAKIEISTERPAGAPVLPETIPLNPVHTTQRPNSITALATSPWAPLAAVSGFQQVLLYETQLGLLSGVLPFPEGTPQVLKFSRNGQLLITGGGQGGASGKVIVWDVKTGNRVAELGNEYDSVLAADISADHTQVVLSGPKRMIRVYSVQTGELMYELKKHTDWVLAAEFSPDGVLLATADRSNGMFLWEALTGNEYLSLKGHTGPITDISWRPDSNVVASSSEDGTIRLWELNDGKEIKRWNAHGGGVSAMDFTRTGKIVSIGRDKVVKYWEADGKEIKSYGGLTDLGLEVAFDAEQNRVLGGDWAGEVRVWDADSAQHLFSLFPNPVQAQEQLNVGQQEFQKVQQTVAGLQSQIKAVEQQIAARQQAVQTAQTQLTELVNAQKKSAADQAAAEKAVKEAQAQVDALKASAGQLAKDLAAANQTAKTTAQTLQTLAAQLTAAQAAQKVTEEQVAQLTAQVEELKTQGEPAQEALGQATQQLQGAQEKLKQEQAAVATLVADKTSTQKKAEQLKGQQTDWSQKSVEVKTALEKQQGLVAVAQKNLEQVKAQVQQIAAKIDAQKKTIAELEKKQPATPEEQKKLTELAAAQKQAEQQMTVRQAYLQKLQEQLKNPAQASLQ